MKVTKSLGMILLAIFLIVFGLTMIIPAIGIQIVMIVLAIIAIAAGLLLLFGKG
jgi:hypothetical protein